MMKFVLVVSALFVAAHAHTALRSDGEPAPSSMQADSSPNDFSAPSEGKGQFVPFGKHVPRVAGINYYTATGVQECTVCKAAVANAARVGPNFHDLCGGLEPEYLDMCKAQQKVLQACPEFVNDWCYQDLGGTQTLRAPCPEFLKCHYCLGVNPLHCTA